MTPEILEDLYETLLDRHGHTQKQVLEKKISIDTIPYNTSCISVRWPEKDIKAKYIALLIAQFIRENVETPAEVKELCKEFNAKQKESHTYIIPKGEIYTNKKDIQKLKDNRLSKLEHGIKKVFEEAND
jgi:hypothetical protein